MAEHYGIALDFESGSRGRLFAFPPEGEYAGAVPMPSRPAAGNPLDGTRAETRESMAGLELPGTADLVIFGEVYLEPLEFDLGLIAETTEHEISIWNAQPEGIAEVSAITKVNDEGTVFGHPPLPFLVMRGAGIRMRFSVLKDGPASQETQFAVTVGSTMRVVRVSGIRMEVFPFEPDWGSAVEIEYRLETVVSRTDGFVEQRRLMFDDPERTVSARFSFAEEAGSGFVHGLRAFAKKAVGVPVWSEPMLPVGEIRAGDVSVDLRDEGAEHCWNLRNLDSVVLIMSVSDTGFFELKEVASAGASIVFRTPVSRNFEDAVIYPVFPGIVSGKKQQLQTDAHVSANLDFREVRLGG